MKHRLTLTIDPAVARRAKKLAHARKTSVSGLVEQFLRSAPIAGQQTHPSIVERWAGKFKLAETEPNDLRMLSVKRRYNLDTK